MDERDNLRKLLLEFYGEHDPEKAQRLTDERLDIILSEYRNKWGSLVSDLANDAGLDSPTADQAIEIAGDYGLYGKQDEEKGVLEQAKDSITAMAADLTPQGAAMFGALTTGAARGVTKAIGDAVDPVDRDVQQQFKELADEKASMEGLLKEALDSGNKKEADAYKDALMRIEGKEGALRDRYPDAGTELLTNPFSAALKASTDVSNKYLSKLQGNLLDYAEEQGLEREEKLEGNISSLRQIENPMDAFAFVLNNTAQTAPQIALNLATRGMSGLGFGAAEIYLENIKILKEKHGLTTEEVLERNLDDPYLDALSTTIHASLDRLGAKTVASSVVGDGAKKSLRSWLWNFIKANNLEGVTESLQKGVAETATIGVEGMEKKFEEDPSNYLMDYLDEWAAGFTGAGGTSAIGSAGKAVADKVKSNKEKTSDATKDAIIANTVDQAEEVINEVTPVAPEVAQQIDGESDISQQLNDNQKYADILGVPQQEEAVDSDTQVSEVEAVDSNVAQNIVSTHMENDGSSISQQGENLVGKEGYSLSLHPDRSLIVEGKEITEEQINKFTEDNKDLLQEDPERFVGTWYDKDSNQTYIDVSIRREDRDDVVKLAEEANQKAIFNLKTLEEEEIGGTGEAIVQEERSQKEPVQVTETEQKSEQPVVEKKPKPKKKAEKPKGPKGAIDILSDESSELKASQVGKGTITKEGLLKAAENFKEATPKALKMRVSKTADKRQKKILSNLEEISQLAEAAKGKKVSFYTTDTPMYNSEGNRVSGAYVSGKSSDMIVIDTSIDQDATKGVPDVWRTAIHELTHPVTEMVTKNKSPEAVKQLETLTKDLDAVNRAIASAKRAINRNQQAKTSLEKSVLNSNAMLDQYAALESVDEFVSEAITNPAFAEILSKIPSKNQTLTGRKSVFHDIIDAIKKVIDSIRKSLGLKKGTRKSASVLDQTLNVMTDVADGLKSGKLVYDPIVDEIVEKKDATKIERKNRELTPEAITGIADAMINDAIFSKQAASKKLSELNKTVLKGNPISKKDRDAIVSEFDKKNVYENRVADQKKRLSKEAKSRDQYKPEYWSKLLNEFLAVDVETLADRNKNTYLKGLLELNKPQGVQDLKVISDAWNNGVKHDIGIKRLNEMGRKLGKDKIKILSKSDLKNLSSDVAILTMANFDEKLAVTLQEGLYQTLMEESARAEMAVEAAHQEMFDEAHKHKLTEKEFIEIQFVGEVLRDGEANYAETVKRIDEHTARKVKAMKRRKAEENVIENWFDSIVSSRDTVEDAEMERKIFLDIKDKLAKDPNSVLDKRMKAYKDLFDKKAAALKDEIKFNTEVIWGEDFIEEENYHPLVARGKYSENEGTTKELDFQKENNDILNTLTSGAGEQVASKQSDRTKARKEEAGNTYYENSFYNVAQNFFRQSHNDLKLTKEAKILNSMLRRDEASKLLDAGNVEKIRTMIAGSLRSITNPHLPATLPLKVINKVKRSFMTVTLGTLKAFGIQHLATIGSTVAMSGAKNTIDATKIVTGKFKDMQGWFEKYAPDLSMRNVKFETYDGPREFSNSKFKKWWDNASRKAESTSTWVFTNSDKVAAQTAFVAAFLDAGGNLESPSKEALTTAGIRTRAIQNSHNQNFVSKMFNPASYESNSEKTWRATVLSVFFMFKSFAWNMMTGNIKAFKAMYDTAKKGELNKGAMKILGAQFANAMFYQYMSDLIIGKLLGGALLKLIGEEPEEKEEEYNTHVGALLAGIYDMFLGGRSSTLIELLNWTLNEWNVPIDRVMGVYDPDSRKPIMDTILGSGKDDDPFNDSPFYSQRTASEALLKSVGPYNMMKPIGDAMEDLINPDKRDDVEKMHNRIQSSMYLFPVMFKGDINYVSKLLERNHKAQKRKTEKANKGIRRSGRSSRQSRR